MIMWHTLILLVLMIVFGILGGAVSYYSNSSIERQKEGIEQSIILGLAASLLVPLFLNMIASDLIKYDNIIEPEKYFVFAGICLSAAIASKSFINKVTNQVWSKYNEIDQRINLVENHLMEPEHPELIENLSDNNTLELNEEDILLKCFWDSPYIFRNINGLCNEVGMKIQNIREVLNRLKSKGYIKEKNSSNGLEMLYLTELGREKFLTISRINKDKAYK